MEGDQSDSDLDRRRLILSVLVIAIAIPIIVEGLTLVGLVGNLVGDQTPTATPGTATVDGVREGDELLPETARTERVTTASIRSGDRWTFVISVRVENSGDVPYDLRLGAVTTGDGNTVSGDARSGPVDPGASGSVTAQYTLPSGERPETIAVRATEHRDDGTEVVVDRAVRIGAIPVQG